MKIKVLTEILEANNTIAAENRRVFEKNNVFVVNLMSAPGTGKTSLLERILEKLRIKFRIGILEGDITSTVDAQRLEKFGVQVVQVNTGGECHLDANMIRNALPLFNLGEIDLFIIENVGNLVCPAEFKVGEDMKIMISSVPEGDDKPKKYPLMFRESKCMIINKIDLLGTSDFSLERLRESALEINPGLKIFNISCKTGEGIPELSNWIRKLVKNQKK